MRGTSPCNTRVVGNTVSALTAQSAFLDDFENIVN